MNYFFFFLFESPGVGLVNQFLWTHGSGEEREHIRVLSFSHAVVKYIFT